MRRRPASSSTILLGYRTDPGRERTNNEDAYIVLLPPDSPPGVDAVLAVADGMGGHQAGEVASSLAIRTVSTRLGSQGIGLAGGRRRSQAVLRDAVEEAHRLIMSKSQGAYHGMGTTLTIALIARGRLHLAHVGDSRAYLLRAGKLKRLTQDHSWVGEEVRSGRLSPEEAASHPRRNLLIQALGTDTGVVVDTETLTLREGDLLLLSSDGLHGVISDEELAAALRDGADPQAVCDRLVCQANERGGPDNITVVLARVGEVDRRFDATTISAVIPGRVRHRRRSPTRPIAAGVVAMAVTAVFLWWLTSRYWGS